MLEELIKDIDLQNNAIELLLYELQIQEKKINKITLSKKEEFFDKYMIKPSILIKYIIKRKKNDK